MKNIILDFCKRNILVLIMIIALCPVLAVSYSSLVISSSEYRASEMYIGQLLYSLEINDTNSNIINIPANSEIEITLNITSLNTVSSNYIVAYNSTGTINAKYSSDYTEPAYGLISNTKTVTVYLVNGNSNNVTVTFNIIGGYNTNELSDIEIPNGYVALDSSYLKYDLNVIAMFVDGVRVDELSQTATYTLESYSCTNGETVLWKSNRRSIEVFPLNSNTKCTLNFVSGVYNFVTYNHISNSYSCSNGSEGNSPYLFTYGGMCEIIDESSNGNGDWSIRLLGNSDTNSGTNNLSFSLPIQLDVFLVGAGSQACNFSAGGAGGFTYTDTTSVTANTSYPIVIGAAGSGWCEVAPSSTAFGFVGQGARGGNGGSGAGAPGTSSGWSGGCGGSDGSNGYSIGYTGLGGTGQITTTREFGEVNGTLYAGGGAGRKNNNLGADGVGGAGGGGNPGVAGGTNTGGGGGANAIGGSGIIVIRNTRRLVEGAMKADYENTQIAYLNSILYKKSGVSQALSSIYYNGTGTGPIIITDTAFGAGYQYSSATVTVSNQITSPSGRTLYYTTDTGFQSGNLLSSAKANLNLPILSSDSLTLAEAAELMAEKWDEWIDSE